MVHTHINGPLHSFFPGKIYSSDLACTHSAASTLFTRMEAFSWTCTRKSMFPLDYGTDTN